MDDASSDYQHIRVNAFAPNLGAEYSRRRHFCRVSDAEFAEINRAFYKHQVLFLRNKRRSLHQSMAFGKKFGRLHSHPAAPTMDGHQEIFEIHANKNSKVANGEHWHSDVSCDEEPILGRNVTNTHFYQNAAAIQCLVICMTRMKTFLPISKDFWKG